MANFSAAAMGHPDKLEKRQRGQLSTLLQTLPVQAGSPAGTPPSPGKAAVSLTLSPSPPGSSCTVSVGGNSKQRHTEMKYVLNAFTALGKGTSPGPVWATGLPLPPSRPPLTADHSGPWDLSLAHVSSANWGGRGGAQPGRGPWRPSPLPGNHPI